MRRLRSPLALCEVLGYRLGRDVCSSSPSAYLLAPGHLCALLPRATWISRRLIPPSFIVSYFRGNRFSHSYFQKWAMLYVREAVLLPKQVPKLALHVGCFRSSHDHTHVFSFWG